MATRKDHNSRLRRSAAPKPPAPDDDSPRSGNSLTENQKKLLQAFNKLALEMVMKSDDRELIDLIERERLEARVAELSSQIRKLKAERKQAFTNEDLKAEIKDQIFDLASQKPKKYDWTSQQADGKKPGEPTMMVPMAVASDWHIGENVSIKGFNEHNRNAGLQKIEKFFDAIIETANNRSYAYPGMVLIMAGDILAGDLHKESRETNDNRPLRAVLEVQGPLIAGIEKLKDRFGNVVIPWVVGNHGRTNDKPQSKQMAETNYEWILGHLLQKHFKDDPNVTFLIPDEPDAHIKVGNHRYMITHGDRLGIAGIDELSRAVTQLKRGKFKLSKTQQLLGQAFDTLVIGHFHNYMQFEGLVANGSLKGYDEYARDSRFLPEHPRQAMWFNHPVHGPTDISPIHLADEKTLLKNARGGPDSEWIQIRPHQQYGAFKGVEKASAKAKRPAATPPAAAARRERPRPNS